MLLFLLVVSGLGFGLKPAQAAVSSSEAYSAVVKINLFTLSGDHFLAKTSHGSGVIISEDGLVLTNYHVVTQEEDYDQSLRDVGYQICLTEDKNAKPDCSYTGRLVTSDRDKDLALLRIKEIGSLDAKSSYPYLEIGSEPVESGGDLTILGYPSIGGETITQTQGVVSGKTNKYNLDWIKTDADISFGNSGGAAVDAEGKIAGITTKSHSDMLGSMGYLVDISSVKDWIDANRSKSSETSPLEDRVIVLTEKQNALEGTDVYSKDHPNLSITKPSSWQFSYNREDVIRLTDENDEEGGSVTVYLMPFPYIVNNQDVETIFRVDNLLFLPFLDIVKTEDVTFTGQTGKKITYSIAGDVYKSYYIPHGEYAVNLEYDYGENDKDKALVDEAINLLSLHEFTPDPQAVISHHNEMHGLSLDLAGTGWVGEEFASLDTPLRIYNDADRDGLATFSFEKRDDSTAGLSNNEIYNVLIKKVEQNKSQLTSAGLDIEILSAKSYAEIGSGITSAIMMEQRLTKGDETLFTEKIYYVYYGDTIFGVDLVYFGPDDKYEGIADSFGEVMREVELAGYTPVERTEDILVYGDSQETESGGEVSGDSADSEPTGNNPSQSQDVSPDIQVKQIQNQSMHRSLRGKIMLKVEDAGKAYYLHPENMEAHYLGRPKDAFAVMRGQGVGISNQDLYKIPVGVASGGQDSDGDGLSDYFESALGLDSGKADTDGDGYEDKAELEAGYSPWGVGKQSLDSSFAGEQKGRILLQVENNGEAWYVNPADGKRYFLGRPADAFRVMRSLGLGISNADFNKL